MKRDPPNFGFIELCLQVVHPRYAERAILLRVRAKRFRNREERARTKKDVRWKERLETGRI
jgi:hypothetical protein